MTSDYGHSLLMVLVMMVIDGDDNGRGDDGYIGIEINGDGGIHHGWC